MADPCSADPIFLLACSAVINPPLPPKCPYLPLLQSPTAPCCPMHFLLPLTTLQNAASAVQCTPLCQCCLHYTPGATKIFNTVHWCCCIDREPSLDYAVCTSILKVEENNKLLTLDYILGVCRVSV